VKEGQENNEALFRGKQETTKTSDLVQRRSKGIDFYASVFKLSHQFDPHLTFGFLSLLCISTTCVGFDIKFGSKETHSVSRLEGIQQKHHL
jgi:hypothetical protein